VRPGDRLLVKPGEIVPVDGVVTGSDAVVDESALTGESTPVDRRIGDRVPSGAVNAASPFDLRAVATAEASTYAAIVRLVRAAESSRAPFVSLADRYSPWFLPLTLLLAAPAIALLRLPWSTWRAARGGNPRRNANSDVTASAPNYTDPNIA